MSRIFKRADYDQTLDVRVRLGDCLPPEHLAHFVVDCVAQLDLSGLYARYGTRGGAPYAQYISLKPKRVKGKTGKPQILAHYQRVKNNGAF